MGGHLLAIDTATSRATLAFGTLPEGTMRSRGRLAGRPCPR